MRLASPWPNGEIIQQTFDANREAIMRHLAESPACCVLPRSALPGISITAPAREVGSQVITPLEFTYQRRTVPLPDGRTPWRVVCAGYVVAEGVE